MEPHVDAVAGKVVNIRDAATEMEFSDVPGFTEGKHSVHEKCKPFEHFAKLTVPVGVVEVEGLEMLPEVAPPARHKAHLRDGGSGWEEGQYMAQNRVR